MFVVHKHKEDTLSSALDVNHLNNSLDVNLLLHYSINKKCVLSIP